MTDFSICAQLDALIRDVPHPIANLANASALLWRHLDRINWAGFYLLEGNKLVLGQSLCSGRFQTSLSGIFPLQPEAVSSL